MDFLPGELIWMRNWRGKIGMTISPFGDVIVTEVEGAGYKGATPEYLEKVATRCLRHLSRKQSETSTEKPLDNPT